MQSRRQSVGREGEATAILEFLEARRDSSGVAVISGEAGIGKTTLWLAATEAARSRGWLVLTSRPSESEAGFSFAGLGDLIGGVAAELFPELPRPQHQALEAALALSDDAGPANEGILGFAFLTILRRLAARGPLVLAIDDVQWLDAPSLAMLRFALPRLESTPVVAVLSVRGAVPAWLARRPDDRLLSIELGPLGLGAIHRLIHSHLGIALPRPTLLRVWETSGGNPFFALELARALQRRGMRVEAGEELPISSTLEGLVGERLDHLGDDGLAVAAVVAALTTATLGLVEAAVPQRAEAGLADAVEAEILEIDGDLVRFRHPILRAAAGRRTVPGRRALHARLAEVVPSREEQARHLALAAMGPDREVAAAIEEAADGARRRGATAAAAELADLALKLSPSDDTAGLERRLLVSADRHADAGDAQAAIRILEAALRTSTAPKQRAQILLRLGRVIDDVQGPNHALGVYREALAAAAGDQLLEAEIHIGLADVMRYGDDREAPLEHARAAVSAATRAGDPSVRTAALATYGLIHFRLGRGVPQREMAEALALERSSPDWPLNGLATEVHAHQLVWSAEVERGRPVLTAWRDALTAVEHREEERALWLLSVLEWRAGNWDLAARHAADSLDVRARFGITGAEAVAVFPAALIAAHQGLLREARERSQQAIASSAAVGPRGIEMGHHWVLGFIELSRGDARAAIDHLRLGWQIRDETGILEPGHRLELGDTLEALVALGELDEAEERLAPWEERAAALDRAWALAITARCRALLQAARGDVDASLGTFDRAIVEHRRAQDPFQHGRTLLAFGATLRRAKRRGAARSTLADALSVFDRLGAPLWAKQARVELARIGGRTRSPGLTPTEERLARLVAEGYSDKEIAARLFVTPKTVGTNLSRIYAKLGMHSRMELAHVVGGDRVPASAGDGRPDP